MWVARGTTPATAEPGRRCATQLCASGTKWFRHPEIGLEFGYEVPHLPEGDGQGILTHTATPGGAASLRCCQSQIAILNRK